MLGNGSTPVLSAYASPRYRRTALYGFIMSRHVVNSLIGLGEGVLKERIFTFDPKASIMGEKTFRASAWLVHPLNNALFTPVMLFITMAVRLPKIVKVLVGTILCTSLVAFGGRTGLIVACLGLAVLGILAVSRASRGVKYDTASGASADLGYGDCPRGVRLGILAAW